MWLLALGIVATLAANVLHGLDHGPIGAAVAAWPALALVGSYELLMTLIRTSASVDGARYGVAIPSPCPQAIRLKYRPLRVFAEHAALRIGQTRAQQV